MMTQTRFRTLGLLFSTAALLTACGGHVSEGTPAPTSPPVVSGSDVPVTATQSAQGATAFTRSVVNDPNETGDGLRIDAADLATSESDEPEPDA